MTDHEPAAGPAPLPLPLPTPAPAPRWGIPDAALGFLGAYILSGLTGSLWLAGVGDAERSFGLAVATLAGLWLAFVGAPVLAARRKGSGSVVRDFGFRLEKGDIPLGLAAGLVSQFVLVRLVYLPFGDRVKDLGRDNEALVDNTHGIALVVLALLLAVGAPLVEELFFRGLLLRSLQKRLSDGWAIAGSSVFFGLAHPNDLPAEGQILVMTALAALAVVLAFLAVRTRRLGGPIVAHAVFNAVNLAVAVSN